MYLGEVSRTGGYRKYYLDVTCTVAPLYSFSETMGKGWSEERAMGSRRGSHGVHNRSYGDGYGRYGEDRGNEGKIG